MSGDASNYTNYPNDHRYFMTLTALTALSPMIIVISPQIRQMPQAPHSGHGHQGQPERVRHAGDGFPCLAQKDGGRRDHDLSKSMAARSLGIC